MNSAEIAIKNGYRIGDTISLYGNAYQITLITSEEVYGVQVVENGRSVKSDMVFLLNLKLEGWRLVL